MEKYFPLAIKNESVIQKLDIFCAKQTIKRKRKVKKMDIVESALIDYMERND